ncbi:hypothetical protein PG988_011553 [Apiospora saccharicola]
MHHNTAPSEGGGERDSKATKLSTGDEADGPRLTASTHEPEPIQIIVVFRSSSNQHITTDMPDLTGGIEGDGLKNWFSEAGLDEGDSDDIDLSDASGRSSLDEFAEWRWLEPIDARITEDQKPVASCHAKLIRRAHIMSNFWVEMEEPCTETSDLAFELFDRYGRLNRKYIEPGSKRGSGVWGRELDHGDLLLFEYFEVNPEARRRVRPEFITLRETDESEIFSERQAISKQFWRSLAFRRIGTSFWFALVDENTHPARQLDVEEDWDAQMDAESSKTIPGPVEAALVNLMALGVSDAGHTHQIQNLLPTDANDERWLAVTENGNTVLHLAAVHHDPKAITYMLSRRPDLASMRNKDGDVPLEALQSQLEAMRATKRHGLMTLVVSDRFEGFEQRSIDCIGRFLGTPVFNLDQLSPDDVHKILSAAGSLGHLASQKDSIDYALRLKYGCTCGCCLGGFLSPRTRHALIQQAQYQHDLLSDDISDWYSNESTSGAEWVHEHEFLLTFLPDPVRQNLKTNKSMRQGFTALCKHFAKCLEKNWIPTEGNILWVWRFETSEWPPVTRNYLARGGPVSAVATMIFERAMSQDEWPSIWNKDFRDIFSDDNLPECRNDLEFGFVSGMCGYKRVSPSYY